MLHVTDTEHAPWHIVGADDKKRARLNCISRLLGKIPREEVPTKAVKLLKRNSRGAHDDSAPMAGRRFVPKVYCMGSEPKLRYGKICAMSSWIFQ
jgi:hypothetical protein